MNGARNPVQPLVLDLGIGNLGNLARALRALGGEPRVSADPAEVAAARVLLLPGVGAFRPAREMLRGPLEAALRAALDDGAWLFGICLGYQLLFASSEEDGTTDGLGLLAGRVTRLPREVGYREAGHREAEPREVGWPHIGWNRLLPTAVGTPHPLVDGLPPDAHAYFVHGYAPDEVAVEQVLAWTDHGRRFAAVAAHGRVLGTQFHPEKSGAVGLAVLRHFLDLAAGDTDVSVRDAAGIVEVPAGAPEGAAAAACTLFPAIDLRGGRVVRLHQGDDARRTAYGDDPLAVLTDFAAAGARAVHLVDLDAAFGEPPQEALLAALLAAARRLGVVAQVGGGVRDATRVARLLAAGATRVVVGSLVLRDPAAFAALARAFPGRIVPALETRGERPQAAGWREASAETIEAVAARLGTLPCPAVLVTDVERDGTLAGPNLALAARVAAASGLSVLVSGGVRGAVDLAAAAATPGVAGVIVGRALYEGTVGLADALAAVAGTRAPGLRHSAAGSALARRVIPCLDVAAGRVVKGVRFRDLADQGDPAELAARYAAEGADEIVFLDVTAAPERRATDLAWVERTAERVFVPLIVGGGVRSVEDARRLLLAGADKVAVNSAAVERPALLAELAARFGRQCVVLAVDAKRVDATPADPRQVDPGVDAAMAPSVPPACQVFTHGGRTPTGRDALAWIAQAVALGAGEILLTSMDADGTRAGYDLELLRAAVAVAAGVPVIASGGVGGVDHLAAGFAAGAQAVLAASIFHQGDTTVGAVKQALAARGFVLRPPGPAAVAVASPVTLVEVAP